MLIMGTLDDEKKYQNKEKGSVELEPLELELRDLRKGLIDKKIKFLRMKVEKKIANRHKREAFPRKSGEYNELFKDKRKESGSREIGIKTATSNTKKADD